MLRYWLVAGLVLMGVMLDASAQEKPPRKRVPRWFVGMMGTYANDAIPQRVNDRGVAFAQEAGLRTDRQLLGARFITPIGGSSSDGITSNIFNLTRGGAETANMRFGVDVPVSNSGSVAFQGMVYARGGNASVGRTWGTTLPWGPFADNAPQGQYRTPFFEPQFYNATFEDATKEARTRLVLGDFLPITWQPAVEPTRNFVDMGRLTFRPFQLNPTMFSVNTPFPPDRVIPNTRAPLRGGEFYTRTKNWELDLVSARAEMHPSIAFELQKFRQALGGRVGYTGKDGGLGFSGFHMYGQDLTIPGNEDSRAVNAGSESLWALDASLRVVGDLYVYGALCSTDFRRARPFSRLSGALITGLAYKNFLVPKGEARLQFGQIEPNYDPLNVRQRASYPENYRIWAADFRVPMKKGELALSINRYGQIDPGMALLPTGSFAGNDPLFPSNARNQGKGHILDVLARADFPLGKLPLHLWLSWENIQYTRAPSGGLANSATSRTVVQEMAMLRWDAHPHWKVDLGAIHFASHGVIGNFSTNVLFAENQWIPRLGLTWTPDANRSARLTWRLYSFQDRVPVSMGLNNYDCSQIVFEFHQKLGDAPVLKEYP